MQREFLTSTLSETKDKVRRTLGLAHDIGVVALDRVKYAVAGFNLETGYTLDKDQVSILATGPHKLSEIRQAIERPVESPTDLAV